MKTPRATKLLALFLAFVFSLYLVPTEVLAAEVGSQSAVQAEIDTETAAEENPEIVTELAEGRGRFQKEYLLSNGQRMLAVYPTAVHYEEDGEWKEIDNTLRREQRGSEDVYRNAAGAWDVTLPASLDGGSAVELTKDEGTLRFYFTGELNGRTDVVSDSADASPDADDVQTEVSTAVENVQTSSLQVASPELSFSEDDKTLEATISDKLNTGASYTDVYQGVDVRYDLQSDILKESIVIRSASDSREGYRYLLQTGELTLTLQEDGSVDAMSADSETPVFHMPAPYLYDANGRYNDEIQVKLTQQAAGAYELTYLLPQEWMNAAERAYPVVLDPIVEADLRAKNIQDQTVAPGKNFNYLWGMVEAGYYAPYGVERFYMQYVDLPALTSADVVVQASISLYKLQKSSKSSQVNVHHVSGSWDSRTLQWSNRPDYDSRVQDYLMVQDTGWYTWDITDIAQKWYQTGNNGMLFKMPDSVENAAKEEWTQFCSADYSAAALPVLYITYINNCGLESYWDYTSVGAGSAGTGYISQYTGNLVWVTDGLGFSGTRMPVAIKHVYNANDKDNNAFGMGYGWRSNYNQLVYPFAADSSYYVWEDEDGTRHYFKNKSSGTYEDEINQGLILTTTGSGSEKYCITDKKDNKSYFDTDGRLRRISNNQATKSSITVDYASGKQISRLTDGAGRIYDFSWSCGTLQKITFRGTGMAELASESFTYADGNLTGIQSTVSIAGSFGYTDNHLLGSVTDSGDYRLRFGYNTTASGLPNRVASVKESDGSADGGSLTISYAHNQTTFEDHNGNREIVQFNNFGSTVSTQDGAGHAQFNKYAGSVDAAKASQLTLSSKLQNTVVNMVKNGSFEWEDYWETAAGNPSTGGIYYSNEVHLIEGKSLAISRWGDEGAFGVVPTQECCLAAQPGQTYTLSAYVQTWQMESGGARVALNVGGDIVAVSEAVVSDEEWTRVEVTYTHPASAQTAVMYPCLQSCGKGYAYFDAVQCEQSANASRYNLIENGDFTWSDPEAGSMFGWHAGVGTGARGESSASAAPQMDRHVYAVAGDPREEKSRYQNFHITGSKGDVYTVAGWAKGDSVPLKDGTRKFGITARFTYTDGTTDDQTVSFNPDAEQWQYAAQRVVAKQDYSLLQIYLVYDNNENTAYFDGIQLFREEFGHSYVYDSDGNITSVTDLQKKTTTYEYKNNNLTKMVLPSGASQTYTYDSYHNVLTATSPEGVSSSFTYDTYGNNTQVSVGGTKKVTASAAYSADGNQLASVTDALGQTTSYGYDLQTGMLQWVQAPGETESTRTNYSYDGKLCATGVSKGASAVGYSYASDLLSAISTASGTDYSFAYGAFDLVQSIQAGSRTLIRHSYSTDGNHQLTRSDYGNGDSVSYGYDSLGRTTSVRYEDGAQVDYTYDNNGNLGLLTDSASGRRTQYFYDFQDRLMRWEQSGSGYANSVTWGYDDNNNLSTQKQTLNGTTYTTSYTYDKDNRLTKTTEGTVSAGYTYDALGRMTALDAQSGGKSVLKTTIGYNDPSSTTATGQVRAWKSGGTTYTYAYDARGNITSVSDGQNTTTYAYDSFDQLVRENNQAAGKTWTYAYDSGGNIQSKTEYAYTTGSLGAAVRTVTYGYGDAGWSDLLTNIGGQSLTADEIGNLLSDGTWTYTWQHGRQLAGMSKSGTNIAYGYDSDGKRITKTVNGTAYNYHYLGDQLVELTWGGNKLHFTYDSTGPLSVSYNGTEYFYVKNAQGDVTGLVSTSGARVVTYTYDAWGNPLATTGSMASTLGEQNPLRYRGYVYDTETGLYYLQSRYYNPGWGRFINADDTALLLSSPGKAHWDKNVFAYCDNNPLNRVDEDGECWDIIIGGIVGGIVSGASSIVNDAIMGRETTVGSVLMSVGAGFAAGMLTAAFPSGGIHDIMSAGIAGVIAFSSAFGGGSTILEALWSAFAASAETYISSKLNVICSIGETQPITKGIINLNVSTDVEVIASVGRGVYKKVTTRSRTKKQVSNPAKKVRSAQNLSDIIVYQAAVGLVRWRLGSRMNGV